MQISHLKHGNSSIRCVNCGHEFEVSRQELSDPYRLTAKKERIAVSHESRCRRKKPERGVVIRTWRHRANGDLQGYFDRAVREMIPAVRFSS
jgi:hypothetical protein